MRNTHRLAVLAGVAALLAYPVGAPARAETVLNVATAGSENMVDYVTDYLAPKFKETHPDVEIRVVGTGPGDAGSQKIYEKLAAQKAAGSEQVDVDVAVVHQKMAGQMVEEGLLSQYRGDIDTGKLVSRDTAKNALGTDVDGFVMPMFHSQTAIAYNPLLVSDPPGSYAELVDWVKEHPGQFGYNGIKNGMSGVSFVVGWIYNNSDNPEQLMKGPYDPSIEQNWADALAKLKDFNQSITFTPSNAGTLDMLNRGEIAMGPVWVDMFYTWQADGRLSPDVKLQLIAPGMPGQPMYYVTPDKAAQPQLARDFIALATSPEVQAEGIVKNFNWYPGIDAQYIQDAIDQATWDKLFADVTPEDLASKGKSFPIGPYFDDILEAYEKSVEN
jgi:ABC-type uncharacterized transport system YnjBCD substrate-binding protein